MISTVCLILLEHKVDQQLGASIFDLKLILQYVLHQWYCDLSANHGYYTPHSVPSLLVPKPPHTAAQQGVISAVWAVVPYLVTIATTVVLAKIQPIQVVVLATAVSPWAVVRLCVSSATAAQSYLIFSCDVSFPILRFWVVIFVDCIYRSWGVDVDGTHKVVVVLVVITLNLICW